MLRFYRIFRDILSWLLGGIILAIIGEFAIDSAREYGFFEHPTERVEAVTSLLAAIRERPWFWPALCGIGGLVSGMWLAAMVRRRAAPAELVDNADLRLHTYGDERSPTRLTANNIWRWYYFRMIMVSIEQGTGKEHRHAISQLFITFESAIKVGTLEIRSPDFSLPQHEVKEFTNRYAIIVFSSELPAGTLDVTVRR
jgi:hypothetical protein